MGFTPVHLSSGQSSGTAACVGIFPEAVSKNLQCCQHDCSNFRSTCPKGTPELIMKTTCPCRSTRKCRDTLGILTPTVLPTWITGNFRYSLQGVYIKTYKSVTTCEMNIYCYLALLWFCPKIAIFLIVCQI